VFQKNLEADFENSKIPADAETVVRTRRSTIAQPRTRPGHSRYRPGPGRSPAVFTNPAIRSFIMAKKGGSKGTSAAVRSAKGKRGNGAQKLKQKKK
jgi:hypothetical protein